MSTHVRIERYTSLPSTESLKAGLECVFFTSSNTQVFSSEDARSIFKDRWLGRYLQHDPHYAYVALSETDDVVGYLIGSADDPAITSRFADLAYDQAFGALSQNYPAHLHVNIAPHYRGCGLGAVLIERFVADLRKGMVPGVHVVTSKNARNVGFYNRNGFHEIAANGVGEREVVLLARKL